MDETTNKDQLPVYEISYLILSSVPEDKVPEEADLLEKIVTDAGASIIAKEAPHRERLAYTMRKKTTGGVYEKCDEAYFGWVKFELAPDKIGDVKNAFEKQPSVLRILVITTVAENTYLGKRASVIAASFSTKSETGEIKPVEVLEEKKEAAVVAPVSIEEMDKSIDEMVKEV